MFEPITNPEQQKIGHIIIVDIFSRMVSHHIWHCNKHSIQSTIPPGVIGFDAVNDEWVCIWCETHEKFSTPCPITVSVTAAESLIGNELVQPWLCDVMSQGERFFLRHRGHYPDQQHAKKAILIKQRTSDRLMEMWEYVPIGREYTVYLNTVRDKRYIRKDDGAEILQHVVWADPSPTGAGGWIPLEMLQIEEAA
jgi:hypothetical protein